jgi:hypothetical protein
MINGGMYFKANGQIRTAKTNGIGEVGILKPDLLYSGMVGQIKMGETAVVGDLVYPNSTEQEFMLADPTQAAIKGPANAILLEPGVNGEFSLALFEGYMKYDAWLTTEYMASKARMDLDVGDVTVDAQTITMNTAVYGNDIADDGIVAGSDFVLVPASTSLAHFKAAFTKAIVNAELAALTVDPMVRIETDWATDILAFIAVNAGIGPNSFPMEETFTNGAFTSATLLGGTDAGIVYAGDVGKPACVASIPATTNDMVQVIGYSLSPTELMFRPITDYDLSA